MFLDDDPIMAKKIFDWVGMILLISVIVMIIVMHLVILKTNPHKKIIEAAVGIIGIIVSFILLSQSMHYREGDVIWATNKGIYYLKDINTGNEVPYVKENLRKGYPRRTY